MIGPRSLGGQTLISLVDTFQLSHDAHGHCQAWLHSVQTTCPDLRRRPSKYFEYASLSVLSSGTDPPTKVHTIPINGVSHPQAGLRR